MLGMMGNVVRPTRPPPLPQLCCVCPGVPPVREAGGGGEEDGARGAGKGGVLDARPGKKRKKKLKCFHFCLLILRTLEAAPREEM